MGNVSMFINPDQANRILMLCWRATRLSIKMGLPLRIPVALVGDTGCGKTESVKAFHAKLAAQYEERGKEFKLYTTILSMVPAEDIGGIPTASNGRVKHNMLECLPFDCNETCIGFADELDRATPETQNAFLQFLLGGMYHGHYMSPNAYWICAMNGTSDIYTNPLSQAARTRMCTIFMSRSAKDGTKSYDNWAERNGIPQVCRTFNSQFGSLIQSTKDFEEMAVCTPRTLDMCGIVTLAKQEVEAKELFEVEDIYRPIIAGLIGMEAMANYMGVEDALAKQLEPQEVLRCPEEAKMVSDPTLVFYLIQAVIGLISGKYNDDMKMVKKAAQYGRRFESDEWIEIWMTSLLKAFPDFVKDENYQKWCAKKQRKGKGMM